jgi:NAD-dependent deacetylase
MATVIDWVRSGRANVRDSVPYCDEILAGGEKCGGPIKSATISFGQSMPEKELTDSFELARSSDLFIVLGSSLVVQPAAMLPVEAKRAGARLVIITASETPLDEIADARFYTPIGKTLTAIAERVAASRN